MKNFADRLNEKIDERGTCAVVGIDPRLGQLPAALVDGAFERHGKTRAAAAAAVLEFAKGVIDAVANVVPAVKPQNAFFEIYGPEGASAFAETLAYARSKGLLVISDVKRGDIGSTSAAYAAAHLGVPADIEDGESFQSDAITVNPYLGTDGLAPFVEEAGNFGKGLFVLARTSNPSAVELQNATCETGEAVFMRAARLAAELGEPLVGDSGFSSVGIVAGATYPEEAGALRKAFPKMLFLVPGYGAQGATAADLAPYFTEHGRGAVVNASRSVIFAWTRKPYSDEFDESSWKEAVRRAAEDMKKDLDCLAPKG